MKSRYFKQTTQCGQRDDKYLKPRLNHLSCFVIWLFNKKLFGQG